MRMSKFEEVTLAKDLSLNGPGFSVIAIIDGEPIVLESSYLKPKGTHGEKLTAIYDEMDRLFKEYKPKHVVREKGFSRFANTTQTLFKVVGVSDYLSHKNGCSKVDEIPTTTVKKSVTGDGNASKEEVASAVFNAFQITNTDDYYKTVKSGKDKGKKKLIDDMTDSLAVGLAFYKKKGLI